MLFGDNFLGHPGRTWTPCARKLHRLFWRRHRMEPCSRCSARRLGRRGGTVAEPALDFFGSQTVLDVDLDPTGKHGRDKTWGVKLCSVQVMKLIVEHELMVLQHNEKNSANRRCGGHGQAPWGCRLIAPAGCRGWNLRSGAEQPGEGAEGARFRMEVQVCRDPYGLG